MKGALKLIKLLIIVGAGLAGFIFCMKNQVEVDVNIFGVSQTKISLYLLILGSFFLGIVITAIYGLFEFLSMFNQIRLLKKDLKKTEKELDYLRTLPIEQNIIDEQSNHNNNYEQGRVPMMGRRYAERYADDDEEIKMKEISTS